MRASATPLTRYHACRRGRPPPQPCPPWLSASPERLDILRLSPGGARTTAGTPARTALPSHAARPGSAPPCHKGRLAALPLCGAKTPTPGRHTAYPVARTPLPICPRMVLGLTANRRVAAGPCRALTAPHTSPLILAAPGGGGRHNRRPLPRPPVSQVAVAVLRRRIPSLGGSHRG